MCIRLIYVFRRHAARQGRPASLFSRNAYAALLVHEVVIIALAHVARDVLIYPFFKWAVVALIAVPPCFGLGGLIHKLPSADRIL